MFPDWVPGCRAETSSKRVNCDVAVAANFVLCLNDVLYVVIDICSAEWQCDFKLRIPITEPIWVQFGQVDFSIGYWTWNTTLLLATNVTHSK